MIEQDLKLMIIDKFGNLKKFSESVDIPWTTLDGVLKRGVNKANITSLIKICDGLNIDCESLYYGRILPKQNLLNTSPLSLEEQEHIKKYRSLSDYDKETVNGLVNRLSAKPTEFVQLMPPIIVPYYGEVASAGTGQFVFDDIPPEMIEIENCMENMHVNFAIGVNGNSMEPTYSDGDTLLVEKQNSINVGEIGIFMIDGEAFVKELGNGVLISHNKDYEDKKINENTICLGKVIGKHIK